MATTTTHTLSEENYLKAIYHLEKQGHGKVSATAIAEELDNNPASVVDMLKRLSDKKWPYLLYANTGSGKFFCMINSDTAGMKCMISPNSWNISGTMTCPIGWTNFLASPSMIRMAIPSPSP